MLPAIKLAQYVTYVCADFEPVELPVILYVDNMAAMKNAMNDLNSDRSKHWDTCLKLIVELCASGYLKCVHRPGADLSADLLTKGLAREAHERHRRALNI